MLWQQIAADAISSEAGLLLESRMTKSDVSYLAPYLHLAGLMLSRHG